MRLPRYGTGTLMLLVVVAALAAALVTQHYRAARRELLLRYDMHRLTPTPHWGGIGRMTMVGDRLVITFQPTIFRREPGCRYRWRFELVDPTGGAVVLSRRDEREIPVLAGEPFGVVYLEVIESLPPPGKYLGRFILTYYEPGSGAPGGWSEMPVHTNTITLPPRAGRAGRRRAVGRGSK
jgi:hypothetical protein